MNLIEVKVVEFMERVYGGKGREKNDLILISKLKTGIFMQMKKSNEDDPTHTLNELVFVS